MSECEKHGCDPDKMKECSLEKFETLSKKFEAEQNKSLAEFYQSPETKKTLLELCNTGVVSISFFLKTIY